MVNYNFDCPKERGFWYDGAITKKVRGHLSFSQISVVCVVSCCNLAEVLCRWMRDEKYSVN